MFLSLKKSIDMQLGWWKGKHANYACMKTGPSPPAICMMAVATTSAKQKLHPAIAKSKTEYNSIEAQSFPLNNAI